MTSHKSARALANKAASLGFVIQVVDTAGGSPNMAPLHKMLEVDLYGSAVVFEEFERVIASGGAGLMVFSVAVHMLRQLPEEHGHALASAMADELLDLPFLKDVPNLSASYMIAKHATHRRGQAAAVMWGGRRTRVHSITPDIIVTPLAPHELKFEIGDGYRAMIAASPSKRMALPEEIAVAAAYLLGPDGGFITGSDPLIDGGVIAELRAASRQCRPD